MPVGMPTADRWNGWLIEKRAASRWYSGGNYRKHTLATPNYGYEKRQKELAKKKKKEEKLKEKQERKANGIPEQDAACDAPAPDEGSAPLSDSST